MKDKLTAKNDCSFDEKQWADFADLKQIYHYKELQGLFAFYDKSNIDQIFFNPTQGLSSNTIRLSDTEYINFSCYNYLGMSGDPEIQNASIQAIHEYGTSVSASRLVSGEKPIHKELEKEIAKFIGVEDSLTFTAGHATNMGTIGHLFNEKDLILFDEFTHNSSLQGIIFSGADYAKFPHNDLDALENLLELYRSKYEKVLILSEGLFSMDGDKPDLPRLIDIKKKFHAILMIDEAHSIGVLGKTGRGICEYFGVNPKDVDILMGTLSKALGSCGGYIAGSNHLIEFLKFKCGSFVFSAGMSPANTSSALASLKLIQKEPIRVETLHNRSKQLLSLLKEAHIHTGDCMDGPIIPVIVHDDRLAIEKSLELRGKGIYALPLFYPAVKKNQARIRLFVNNTHTEDQIQKAAEAIIEVVK